MLVAEPQTDCICAKYDHGIATSAIRRSQRTQRERSDATTNELIAAARELFAAGGYRGTSLDDVVEAVGLTKGAIYHHFASKDELFAAVFENEEQRLAEIGAH